MFIHHLSLVIMGWEQQQCILYCSWKQCKLSRKNCYMSSWSSLHFHPFLWVYCRYLNITYPLPLYLVKIILYKFLILTKNHDILCQVALGQINGVQMKERIFWRCWRYQEEPGSSVEGYVQIVLAVVIGPLMDIDVIYSKKKLHVIWGKTQPNQTL